MFSLCQGLFGQPLFESFLITLRSIRIGQDCLFWLWINLCMLSQGSSTSHVQHIKHNLNAFYSTPFHSLFTPPVAPLSYVAFPRLCMMTAQNSYTLKKFWDFLTFSCSTLKWESMMKDLNSFPLAVWVEGKAALCVWTPAGDSEIFMA